MNDQSDKNEVMEDKIRRRKWWCGLEEGSGGVDYKEEVVGWKRDERGNIQKWRAATFEFGFLQVSEELQLSYQSV